MKLPPWSFSSLQTFEQCPKKWEARYILKSYKEPVQPHQQWGTDVHKDLELRIKDGTPLPERTAAYESIVQSLLKFPATERLAEWQIGLDDNLKPCGFFDKNVWWRGVVDVCLVGGNVAVSGDFKTGKRKPDFTQLDIFGVAVFSHRPQLEKQLLSYYWLKTKQKDSKVMSREDIPKVWRKIIPRVEAMEKACETETFHERPGPLCGWCYLSSCRYCPNK